MSFGSWFARVVVLAASVFAVAAPSELKGETSGFLTVDKSPYTVSETIVVGEGKGLVVEAGAVLEFKQGAGLDVRGGSLSVMGKADSPVVFRGVDEGSWNGISVTGNHKASLSYLQIDGAEIGLAVERGSVSMSEVDILNAGQIGFFAKDASVQVNGGAFNYNAGVALWLASGVKAEIEGASLFANKLGIVLQEGAKLKLDQSNISGNEIGLVSQDWNSLNFSRLSIEGNQVGLVQKDSPSDVLKNAVNGNDSDFSQDLATAMKNLPDAPENPEAEVYSKSHHAESAAPVQWAMSGNVAMTFGYHAVWTETDENGEEYPNLFQVPGPFTNASAYMQVRSTDGKLFELSANLSMDRWNYFDPENVLAVYRDSLQRIALGDMYLLGGETYLAGIDLLGASYDFNLLRNSAGVPMFMLSAFGGESRAPKLVGERNKDIYKDYIEDGEAEPQQLIVGGKVRWNLDRRFNATVGFIGNKDELEDPLLRDGSSANVNTAVPMTSSRAFFADAEWKMFPGNLTLNAQLAVGGADTSGVLMQRAVNKVFSDAGLDVSNYAKLRRLMNNQTLVELLSRNELEEIFGENAMMTEAEMRSALKTYLERAKRVLADYEDDEDSHVDIKKWSGENLAWLASMHWAFKNTVIDARMRFVGPDYFSAGSPDLLQNSREWFVSLNQKVMDFWKLNAEYKLEIENAAHGEAYNVFGFAEGSTLGLLPGADDDWLKKHEQDDSRTLYDHTAKIANAFDVGNRLKIAAGYAFNYRTRSTDQRLYANYSAASGIYSDPWFAKRGGATIDVVDGDDTLKVDSARWAKYYALAGKPYLATQFEENIAKHTFNLGLSLSLPYNTLNVGGVWCIRRDYSGFEQDKLISDLDFSDETFGILGYYFHGGDYFEQSYPVSLLTVVGKVRNRLSVVPRYKVYERDNMDDFEWRIAESLQMPIVDKFIDLSLTGLFRQEFLNRDEGSAHVREVEMDVGGSLTLGFTHLKNLTSSWTVGALYSHRPDLLSDEYFDLYGMATVNYAF